MKQVEYKHKNLLGGKKVKLYYPIADREFQVQLAEVVEHEQYHMLKKKGKVLLDIGANVGVSSLYLKDYYDEIYAIEPNPQNYECLVKNTKKYKNIKTYNFAASFFTGNEFMYQTDPNSVAQSFFPYGNIINKQEVSCKRLDEFVEEEKIKHIDSIKIDVEGSEFVIFPHSSFKKVAKITDRIMGEGHYTVNQCFPEVIPDMLEEYGFKTMWDKKNEANYRRELTFRDPVTGEEKTYKKTFYTIFYAEKENKK